MNTLLALNKISTGVRHLAANVIRYPAVFVKVNQLMPELPDDAQEEITRLTTQPMDDAAGVRVMELINDYVCDLCGKPMSKCLCEEDE